MTLYTLLLGLYGIIWALGMFLGVLWVREELRRIRIILEHNLGAPWL